MPTQVLKNIISNGTSNVKCHAKCIGYDRIFHETVLTPLIISKKVTESGLKIYLPWHRTVGAKLGFIEFESQFSEKSKVFMFFKSCNKLIS